MDNSPQAIRYEQNTKQISSLVRENNLFPMESSSRELFNVFTGKPLNKLVICCHFERLGNKVLKTM